ncbi:MAG: ComF family protein [Cellvibrionaceae bacterium]
MDLLATALDMLLPHRCLLCSDPHAESSLCNACRADLPWLDCACMHCALPLPEDAELCGRCLTTSPSFDRCRAAFRYTSPIDRLIGQFKNQRHLGAGKLLSHLLADEIRLVTDDQGLPELIAPVPLHWRRQLQRGFNQAAFVAEALARELNIPLVAAAKRCRATPKQQQLNRKQRLRNLDCAFVINEELVRDRQVAIVDDVVTTGATAEALGRQLKKAGARRVEVWALARTPAPAAR